MTVHSCVLVLCLLELLVLVPHGLRPLLNHLIPGRDGGGDSSARLLGSCGLTLDCVHIYYERFENMLIIQLRVAFRI